MKPARSYPARRDDVRLLVVDPEAASFAETRTLALPGLLAPGDLLVVNDAATLPASLLGHDDRGRAIELRLLSVVEPPADAQFWAALLGAGDWRQRTEDRRAPPPLGPGDRLRFGDLGAEIVARAPLSPRLVSIRFDAAGDGLWAALPPGFTTERNRSTVLGARRGRSEPSDARGRAARDRAVDQH